MQSAAAIYKQLHDYKSGSRINDVMTGMAQALEDDQILEVAAHLASSTTHVVHATTAPFVDAPIVRGFGTSSTTR